MKKIDTSRATAARRRPVVTIDSDGDPLLFRSIKEASDALGIPSSHICRNCRGQQPFAGGYQFKYVDE